MPLFGVFMTLLATLTKAWWMIKQGSEGPTIHTKQRVSTKNGLVLAAMPLSHHSSAFQNNLGVEFVDLTTSRSLGGRYVHMSRLTVDDSARRQKALQLHL